ncbi:Tim17-domain-containing protein [Pseudovirgaria hyperparasitica]|uniref:Mitochondrial import inner membrane translocase subunit TIM22 n=1 Tax=Pseudovirgaria hyperparasitica TaxID=470096 RepID=A0A6A6VW64_9PEZI|nr:Tim17-domain-containing protein [Pseudovirgaria hyperparasitica]KAF2753944.1 Tim17-domain-containing protein [Pseudovirgaria hyperparasitica]
MRRQAYLGDPSVIGQQQAPKSLETPFYLCNFNLYYSHVAMAFPGMGMPGGQQSNQGVSDQEQMMIKYMTAGMESCPFKAVLSGVMGFGLGGAFGLFMSSMRYDTPMSSPQSAAMAELPLRQQLRQGAKEMGRASWSSAKNFGMIGGIYSGTECAIEKVRAKNDLWNGISAGCLTGGALAMKAGPQATALGCAGFAAFSAAIDAYMRGPDAETSRPID